jgi:hypothetical protein
MRKPSREAAYWQAVAEKRAAELGDAEAEIRRYRQALEDVLGAVSAYDAFVVAAEALKLPRP